MSIFWYNIAELLRNLFFKKPYITMVSMILFFFTFIVGQGRHIEWIGDYYVYLELAQTLFSKGVLYQSAIDTKNMGFFFIFYYLFYKPYALLFSNTEYLVIWHGLFLSLIYFYLIFLIYSILQPMYGKVKALISSSICLAYLIYPPHGYFISQPQIAVCFHLFLIYYVLHTYVQANYKHYFVYGFILGLCFSVSSPYIVLAITIPFLVFKSFYQDRIFRKMIVRGCLSFFGFLLALVPFFLYFYRHNALLDWWYWNYEFTTGYYSSSLSTYSIAQSLSVLSRFLHTIRGIFGGNLVWGYLHIPGWTAHLFIYCHTVSWIIILYKKSQKIKIEFSDSEIVLFVLGALSLLVRLSLVRNYSSYNIYLIPFLILQIPMMLNILVVYAPKMYKCYRCCLIIMMIVAVFFGILRYSIFSLKDQMYYPFKALTLQNPHKVGTTVMITHWAGYTYSTRWNHVYHNFYSFLDHDFEKHTYVLQPEVLVIRTAHRSTIFSMHKDWDSFLDTYYTLVIDVPHVKAHRNMLFPNHYLDDLQGKLYIRKDKLDTWNIPSEFTAINRPMK